ncbi:hypothetical protein [Brevifollis gellanilyticus]|uniref:DUF5666 domain-containing protein n=1 Tax=Brevifollis gellanilyticus TaxID=748831 RepID=A0A512MG59_9BACT|nr:hypothetical protein [Brevifollis gellanilyticus]GEP45730.1 hypothetical protein BGE01nite_50210 [Brevifollis gellanilyticus]
MKTLLQSAAFAVLAVAFSVQAQSTTQTTTTTVNEDGTASRSTKTVTTSGTLTEYTPGSTFIVKETSGPITYRYGTKVAYVTRSGKILTDDDVKTRIKVGIPVSVHYGLEGETRVINRVVIDD